MQSIAGGTVITRLEKRLRRDNKLTAHISHRHRPERGNCGLGNVTLFVELHVDWCDVGKDAAQRVQLACFTGCKATHRTPVATVVESITECATTND